MLPSLCSGRPEPPHRVSLEGQPSGCGIIPCCPLPRSLRGPNVERRAFHLIFLFALSFGRPQPLQARALCTLAHPLPVQTVSSAAVAAAAWDFAVDEKPGSGGLLEEPFRSYGARQVCSSPRLFAPGTSPSPHISGCPANDPCHWKAFFVVAGHIVIDGLA